MEGLLVLFVVGIFFAPIVLSIVALTQSSRVARELRELKKTLAAGQPASQPPPAATAPGAPSAPQPPPITPAALHEVLEIAPPPPPTPVQPKPKPKPDGGLEVALGGKVASFIGIAALVTAVVFFVGYAIQHGYIGPGTRIVLGLLTGAFLVFLGHRAEISERNLKVLARALTGGGAALFYFCVFAAYKMYHLVGATVTSVGLIASAAAVLALSIVYASQAVAVLGLLGAYLAPVLLGDDFQEGLFPLLYVAVVNLPVIVLGRRNNWQVLLGLATLSTTLIAALWLGDEIWNRGASQWATGLVFVVLYYAEFAALGVMRLGMERRDAARTADILRLLFASMALLGAFEWVLKAAGHGAWRGTAYLVAAVVHVGIVQFARQRAPAFKDEVLAFTVIALTFASLALPAQLDGAWVSLGWSIEGALLAWFALRIRSPLLQAGALGLGLLGLGKSVLYDFSLYDAPPQLFLNSRFAVGFLSSLLMGVQGRFHAKADAEHPPGKTGTWAPVMYCISIVALLFSVFGDAFFALDFNDPWPWAITTLAVLAAGLAAASARTAYKEVALLGTFLLLLVPAKIIVFDVLSCWPAYKRDYGLFLNALFFIHLIPAILAGYGASRLARGERIATVTNIAAIGAVLLVVTMELQRLHGDWAQSLVTIWWAVAALALVIMGLARRRGYLRYCGLAVFAVTVAKVFIVDLGELGGLERIAAFFGVGVLMLVLSYAYQRVAPMFLKAEEDPQNTQKTQK